MIGSRPRISLAVASAIGAMSCALPAAAQEQPQALDRVEVTGSSIRRVQGETALPVTIITREDIQRSGVSNVEQLVQRLSAASSAGNLVSSAASGATTGGLSGISLRGLTSLRTLVLINGRRVSPYGIGFTGDSVSVDVNSIPLAAIERVEILRDGASAVYGSDAIAGVVNFILRKDFRGLEVSAEYGQAEGKTPASYRASAAYGIGDLNKDRFNVFGVVSYVKEEALFGRDRKFARSGINEETLNDTTSGNTFPANIFIPVGNGLSRNPAAPACPGPYAILDPLFPPNRCRFDPSPLVTLLPDTERIGLFLSGRYQLTNNMELFAEASYNRGKQNTVIQPVPISDQFALPPNNPLFGVNPYNGFSTIVLRPTSPFYPTQYIQSQTGGGTPDVLVRYRAAVNGNRDINDESTAPRLAFGLRGNGAGWDYETAFLYSSSSVKENVNGGYPSLSRILPILNSGQVNFFGPNTPAIDAALRATNFTGQAFENSSSLISLGGKGSRELFAMQGGNASLAVGGEIRKESYKVDPDVAIQTGDISGYGGNFLPVDRNRNVYGVFVEMEFPILKNLTANAAVRYDDYETVGGTTNPKLSLRYQPTREVLLRGAIGTGFRAPSLADLYSPNTTGVTPPGLSDPLRCVGANAGNSNDCQTQFPILNGGSTTLKPEESTNVTLGFVIEPMNNVSLGLDFFSIRIKELITNGVPAATILQNLNQYGSLVTRGAVQPGLPNLPGPITQISQTNINIGRAEVAGLDLDAQVGTGPTAYGRYTLGITGTYFTKYRTENTDGTWSPNIGEATASATGGVIPRWKHYASVNWQAGSFSTTLANNYQTGYTDLFGTFEDGSTPARRVGAYSTWDLQTTYSAIRNLTLSVGVRNLFDKDPPYTNVGGQLVFQAGYDPSYADPRGRFGYVRGTYKFF
jgi:iron complex outermembrane receptor protein